MTSTALPFEAASEPDSGSGFEAMPVGQYPVFVSAVENKATKAGTGLYAKIEFTVADGHKFAGRKIWSQHTVSNPNAQAVAIGKRQLGELSYACGNTMPLTDLQQVYAKRCLVDLVIKVSDQYGAQNEVKSFLPLGGGNQLPATQGGTQQQVSSSSPAAAAKPWEQ